MDGDADKRGKQMVRKDTDAFEGISTSMMRSSMAPVLDFPNHAYADCAMTDEMPLVPVRYARLGGEPAVVVRERDLVAAAMSCLENVSATGGLLSAGDARALRDWGLWLHEEEVRHMAKEGEDGEA